MNKFSPSKGKKWAIAARGIIRDHSLALNALTPNTEALRVAHFSTPVSPSEVDLVMTCVHHVLGIALKGEEGNPKNVAAIKAMRKIVVSYRNGQIPNDK